MDILAHFLWTFAIFHRYKYKWLIAIFGVLPDFASFGPFFIYNLFTNNFATGKPNLNSIPEYVFMGYNFTHSLIIFLIVLGIIYFITRNIPLYLFGWAIHIIIDIPTHTNEFFPTPFLWPLSDYHFSGVSWGNPTFMIVNYSLLVFVYIYIVGRILKNKNVTKK
jgi:hypothetical protein